MSKKSFFAFGVLTMVVLLSSCASIVTGTSQSLSVHTGRVGGATCSLANNKGIWYINSTPGSVVVHRSYAALRVDCSKPGYGHSYRLIPSRIKPMVFGNILFGGLIGAVTDVVDGAAYTYPQNIYVPMHS